MDSSSPDKALGGAAEGFRAGGRAVAAFAASSAGTLARYFRPDVPIAVFALVYLVLFAPLIPRNTEDPQLLAAYANDEPFLTMALEATLVAPYGNPGAYFDPLNPASSDVPEHWGSKRYSNITYYGGALFMLASPPYALLRAIGAPPFPTGPVVLRTLTLLAALLSIVVLYNLAKERGSRLVGLLAGAWLAADPSFIYYANFIHPDTLQMLFALLAFAFAVAHARDGKWNSLVALGIFCGLVQGAKAGGPWTVPMALIAVWLGSPAPRAFAGRVVVLGAAALGAFFVSTPYAFLDSYYRRAMELAWDVVSHNTIDPGKNLSLATWTEAVVDYLGPIAVALLALTVGRALWLLARRRGDIALSLALVLGLSQFLWFGISGKLWHVPGYLILSFGLLAVFAFETLLAIARSLVGAIKSDSRRRLAWGATAGAVVAFVALSQWYVPASWIVDQHMTAHSTVRAANEWAVDEGVARDAVIVYDDLAYFDPNRFPNATLHGGVLTWPAVVGRDPDYVVLSQSLWGAEWMQNLIRTQRLTRTDPDPFNVRLYQDLLETKAPGPTRVPGVRLEADVEADATLPGARLAGVADACRGPLVCDSLAHAADVERRLRALASAEDEPLVGPELRIYGFDGAAMADGSP